MRPPSLLAALAVLSVGSHASFAQGSNPAPASSAQPPVIQLHAVLTGPAADSVQPAEVTLLDNDQPVPIQSWRALGPGSEPVHVILVIDDVNADVTTVAYERNELKKFLTHNDGQLRVPFSTAVITDTETQIQRASRKTGWKSTRLFKSTAWGCTS